MRRTLIALAGFVPGVALAQIQATTMVGRPLPPQQPLQSTGFGRPIPTSPFHNGIPSQFRDITPRRQSPARFTPAIVVPGYFAYYNPYYNPYYAQPQPDVNVTVNNVIETPPPVIAFVVPAAIGVLGDGSTGPVRASETSDNTQSQRATATQLGFVHSNLAEPADVGSLSSIIASLYDVISGPPKQVRDWNRFRSLFAEGARLIPTVTQPGLPSRVIAMTPDEYADNAAPLLTRGFYEKEVSSTVEQFGRIAQVFSTYESRYSAMDPKPFQRGINSIQLLNDGTRWWIISVYWDAERADNPIPAKYLGAKK